MFKQVKRELAEEAAAKKAAAAVGAAAKTTVATNDPVSGEEQAEKNKKKPKAKVASADALLRKGTSDQLLNGKLKSERQVTAASAVMTDKKGVRNKRYGKSKHSKSRK